MKRHLNESMCFTQRSPTVHNLILTISCVTILILTMTRWQNMFLSTRITVFESQKTHFVVYSKIFCVSSKCHPYWIQIQNLSFAKQIFDTAPLKRFILFCAKCDI